MAAFNDFVNVMDNVLQHVSTNEIGLSAKGEVCINNDLTAIIHHAKHIYNIPYIYISTNGSLLTDTLAKEIIDAGIDSIKFSINAFNRSNYRKVHGKDDFDIVIQNFINLLRLKKEKHQKLKLMVSFVENDFCLTNPIDEFKKIFRDHFQYIDSIKIYKQQKPQKMLSDATHTRIFETWNKPLCRIPFDEIWINADCSLVACCKDYFDSINYGSLLENDYLELYQGEKFKNLMFMLNTGNFPKGHICKMCLQRNLV